MKVTRYQYCQYRQRLINMNLNIEVHKKVTNKLKMNEVRSILCAIRQFAYLFYILLRIIECTMLYFTYVSAFCFILITMYHNICMWFVCMYSLWRHYFFTFDGFIVICKSITHLPILCCSYSSCSVNWLCIIQHSWFYSRSACILFHRNVAVIFSCFSYITYMLPIRERWSIILLLHCSYP